MSMDDWLFDLGNTRLKSAPLAADGTAGAMQAVAHGGVPAALPDALPHGRVAYLASVAAPALTTALLEALTVRFRRIAIARTVCAFAGVRIAYAAPERLGVDRFLALLGAHVRGAGPWLVVGVGTALTLDLLAADGRHHGGRIAPSPQLMREALHARAPQLPLTGGDYAEFAADTGPALASGAIGAALALIERSRTAGAALLGATPRLLLHGGGVDALQAQLAAAEAAPALVLEGLARWANVRHGSAERGTA